MARTSPIIDNRSVQVALFVTCLADTLFPEVGRATVTVLERLGVEVRFPIEQTCCGQLHRNSGAAREAAALEERFARVFADHETIVTPSASCAAHVRERCGATGARVRELSTFLVDDLGATDVGARFAGVLTYHPTCHSLRALGLREQPGALLQAVEGAELVELPDASECCGFGGTFAVKNPDVSSAMLADKLAAVETTGADVVCACDASCLMHIRGGLERRGSRVRALHLAEVLAG
jgi:L-lactate dehydrogenase complex protein LldE